MEFIKNILILTFLVVGLSSCYITEQIGTIQLEVMKPGVFVYPEQIKNVAVFRRDLYKSDTVKFKYYNEYFVTHQDTSIKYADLSNCCIDSLTGFLKSSGYFVDVRNFRDSLFTNETEKWITTNRIELAKLSNAEMFIFLDFFNLNGTIVSDSRDYISTNAALSWQIGFKSDTMVYIYNQLDTLSSCANIYKQKSNRIKLSLVNFSKYLGKSFVTKLIPSWSQVSRMYYKSANENLIKGEKYAIENDWLKAAEYWRKESRNKKPAILAKACYNMALAAEMNSEYDAAIDWLIQSHAAFRHGQKEHRANCQQYINVLALRKKEIELLDKQIRKN
jgi:hypothetical protein